MIAPGLLLVSASQTRFWPGLAGSLVLLAFSTLPGLMFYPVVETTIGVFAATALASYVALATALQAVSGAVRTNRSRRAQNSKHHAQTGT